MIPRILVIEARAGEAVLSAYTFLKSINCNIYIATLINQKLTPAFCKENNYVFIENLDIIPIDEKYTTPRLGIYTPYLEQETCYLAYYQKQRVEVQNRVDYLIKRVNPTHILTNIGLVSMYNVFLRSAVSQHSNVIYYAEKPYSTKTNYLAVNEIMLKPRLKKISLSPKEISSKLKVYEKFYSNNIITLYPDIMTYPEEIFKF